MQAAEDVRLVLCEECHSEGRELTNDGSPYDQDWGPCLHCAGTGVAIIDVEPITMQDLDKFTAQ